MSAFEVRSTPGHVVAAGEIDMQSAPELEAAIREASDGSDAVSIDFAEVTFMDSTGLRTLVRSSESGCAITLREVQEPVRRLLEITNLTELFGSSTE